MRTALATALLMGLCASSLSAGDEATRPNIVWILVDNVGYGDLGAYSDWHSGERETYSPRIDQLAEESVRLDNFYVTTPSCAPSRGSLLTGRYPQRNGLENQPIGEENYEVALPRSETLLPALLKDAGYATAAFGKWNIGWAEGVRPTERGFDEFFGHVSGNMDYYNHTYRGIHDTYRGTENVHINGYSTDLFADAAVDFIDRHQGEPFFLYVPFNAMHYPGAANKAEGQPVDWQAPPEAFRAIGASPFTNDPKKRFNAAMKALDTAIGRILDAIEKRGLRDDTILVFFSDNGAIKSPEQERYRDAHEAPRSGKLRGGAATMWEGGIRVPAIVRYPGVTEPGTVSDELLMSIDFFAMALAAAGIDPGNPPNGLHIDGRDPTPVLGGSASPRDALQFEFRGRKAVRKGPWKLIQPRGADAFKLYDLTEDINETTNVADEHPDVAERLERRYERWEAQFED